MWHDLQLGLAFALLVGGAVWLNGLRAGAAARAASYRSDAAEARIEYAHHMEMVRSYGQQPERVRQDGVGGRPPGDSVSRAAASLLRVEEEHAALAATRMSVLVRNAHAALRESRWFAAGMVAVLALGVLPAWHWRRVQRRRPRKAPAAAVRG
jgi:hypothetical protein